MVIARMLIRGGLFTLALTAGMAAAKAVCRMMRSPLPDAEPQRTRSERVGNRSASKIEAPVQSPAIRRASSCVSRRIAECRSLRRTRCGLFATASDFLHRRHYQLWTSVSNKADTFTAAGWRKPVWRLAEAKRPSLRICSRKRISRSDARGSLLACMTANREPSNQSFEVDREATVCSASRRFFLR